MAEDPKALTRRFYAEVSAGNVAVVDELLADDFAEHEELPGGLPRSREGVRQLFTMIRSAFPDCRMEPHEVLEDGDLVCARVTLTGTHEGDFAGIPPTGKRIEVQMIDILRVRDGKATEHWGTIDEMALMRQLGVIPDEPPA
ncbi:MAG: ester cyclase [Solirubrobacteraceae bacterium]